MLKLLGHVPILVLLLVATTLEVSGDAVVRIAIYKHAGLVRLLLFAAGAVLLLGYGSFLNAAPVQFERVVGVYIATLFVVWQVVAYLVFRSIPTVPVVIGGALIVAGGAIITFWNPA